MSLSASLSIDDETTFARSPEGLHPSLFIYALHCSSFSIHFAVEGQQKRAIAIANLISELLLLQAEAGLLEEVPA